MFPEADVPDELSPIHISAVHAEQQNSDYEGLSDRVQKQKIIVKKSKPNRIVNITPNPNELIPFLQKPIFKKTLGRVLDTQFEPNSASLPKEQNKTQSR